MHPVDQQIRRGLRRKAQSKTGPLHQRDGAVRPSIIGERRVAFQPGEGDHPAITSADIRYYVAAATNEYNALADPPVNLAELKRANVTYLELAERLKAHGLPGETESSIKAKLKRGTFAATFLLATLAALEMEGIRLEDL
jgi:hypothetical protein